MTSRVLLTLSLILLPALAQAGPIHIRFHGYLDGAPVNGVFSYTVTPDTNATDFFPADATVGNYAFGPPDGFIVKTGGQTIAGQGLNMLVVNGGFPDQFLWTSATTDYFVALSVSWFYDKLYTDDVPLGLGSCGNDYGYGVCSLFILDRHTRELQTASLDRLRPVSTHTVPEPSALLLFGMSAMAFWRTRHAT